MMLTTLTYYALPLKSVEVLFSVHLLSSMALAPHDAVAT
jgi:hypothetical protein